MAEKKKVFQIQINGLTESVDAVKTLNEQLRECEGIINNLKDAKIDVKVSSGTKPTEKVGSGKGSNDSKVELDVEKEKTKQLEMQNDALREQYVERERLKQANKESLQDIKDEAKGYAEINDGVKTYANTLNGMSAELKDIKKELRNTEVGTEAFDELTQKAATLNEKLKLAEEAYGQFGRNVGNYTQSILDALEEWDENREFNMNLNVSGAEGSLKDLKLQLAELKQYWQYLSPDDANFDKTAQAIKSLNQQIEDMESKLKDVGAEANSTFTGRFTTTIGGVEASFSNASEACEALRKKLVAMRVAGEENTPMYTEIINLVRRLGKEVQTANKQIEGMTKTTQSIGKVVSVMKGLSSVAALGQGIAGLFGGSSEELDKLIQKFASLTLVMTGLSTLEEELNKGTSSFAKITNAANDFINTIPGFKQLKTVSDGLGNLEKLMDIADGLKTLKSGLAEARADVTAYRNELHNLISTNQDVQDSFRNLSNEDVRKFFSAGSLDELRGYSAEMDNLIASLERASAADDDFKNTLEGLFASQGKANDIAKESSKLLQEQRNVINANGGAVQKLSNVLLTLASSSKFAATAIKGVTVAIKALGKTLLIGLALEALSFTIEKVVDGLKALWGLVKKPFEWLTFQQGEKEAKKLIAQIDSLERKLDSLKEERKIQITLGNVGEVEGQIKDLQDRLESLGEEKTIFNNDREFAEWQQQLRGELDKTDDNWKKLTESEKEATEALQALAEIDPKFFTKLKGLSPEKQLEKINAELKKVGLNAKNMAALESFDDKALEDLLDKLSDIDMDLNDVQADAVKSFAEFGKALMKARSDAASAAGRIKKDLESLTKREYQLMLNINDDDIKTRLEIVKLEMEALAQTYGMKIRPSGSVQKKDGSKMNEEEREIAQRIANINALEVKAAKKANKEAQDRKNKENADAAKKSADDAKKRARNEANARLEAMEDGLNKEIALLEQKRKEEIEDAKETGKRVVDINTIYDRKVLEVKKKYAKYVEDVQREHNKRLLDIAKEFASEWTEIQRQIEDERADTAMGKVENKNMSVKQNITYDVSTQGTSEGIDAQKEYYEKMRKLQDDYIKEKEQLDIEAAQREHQRLIEDENARYQSEKDAYEAEIEEQERALKEKVDNAQISQEEMDTMLTELRKAYYQDEGDRLAQHEQKIASITKHGEEVVTTIQLEAQNERQKNNIDAYNNQIEAIQTFYNDIDKVMERTQKRKTNQFGFIDYGAYRKSLQDALNATKETANQIEEQKAQLQADLNAKKISFDDFQKAKKQLDDFAEEVKDKTKEMQDALNGSFNSWMGGVMNSINQYASVLSGMFDTISEMYTRQLDAQQEKLDKQQELLDKELEMIEENLQKQEEITEQHKDKINSVEDELKSARGDRRQALIDQLAAERKAAEESIKKEKQVTEEKKKNQQKQEQLKKQQDALDKKRRQQEKKIAIVQATINTFTAVTNALAVQPWFVGLALSAVALGLGMANVAQISSMQYADGGLLNGKRHSQGGMKIQGTNMEVEGGEYVTNRASTNANLPLLEYINSNRRTLTKDDLIKFYDNGKTTLINRPMQAKFEEGGQLPQLSVNVKDLMSNAQAQNEQQTPVVSVVDIINAMDNVQQVRVLAGDIDND